MGEVDRRGFLRLRRSDKDEAAEAAPPPPDPEILQLAEHTTALLADLDAADEEQLAEGTLLTGAYDRAYMRVTTGHIVSSFATGLSVFMETGDVEALHTEPPVENDRGHGPRVLGIIHAHHPADLPTVTRSYTFRFPVDSPLIPAIRTACDLPEPEPEPEEAEEPGGAGAVQTPGNGGGNSLG
ncbi:MAG: hypothetical protein AB1679_27310 [Actinomycetota bacterium]|jgi:hypothetical protein